MAAARQITRFGRTFVEYDPDGPGGGPPTWILAAAGPGSGGGPSGVTNGLFKSATPGAVVRTGMALYFSSQTEVDLAVASDATGGGASPYLVAGLANMDAFNGQLVGLISDGQLTLGDWTQVTGAANLDTGKRYYLSNGHEGQVQPFCPTTPGSTVVCVGQAVSPLTLEVEIDVMVRL